MLKVTSDVSLNSLASGSKKRLKAFQRHLVNERTKVIFDDQTEAVLDQYALNPNQVFDTKYYLKHLKDQDGYYFSQSLYKYDGIVEALERFQQPNYTSFRWNKNYQNALRDVKEDLSHYRLRSLVYSSDEDMISALPKTDTHSGFTYIETGKKKKGENLGEVFSKYMLVEEQAKGKRSFDRVILPGSRTQGSGAFEETGYYTGTCKHKTRLVSMVDMFVIFAELKFAKPVQDALATYYDYAGGKSNAEISKTVLHRKMEYGHYVSLDYSHFDQSINDWQIEDAFEVIASMFIEYDRELFDVVVHDFIHKKFLCDKGLVHSDRGVPSGSMFTQLIDTIVNLIMIRTYMNAKKIWRFRCLAMGDDNIIFYGGATLDLEDISSYLKKNFDVIVNAEKSTSGDRFSDPQFLSMHWTNEGAWRHPNILISKLLYPERFRDYRKQGATPELVVYSYILAYPVGMRQLIDVNKFLLDHPFTYSDLRKLPVGAMSGYLEYKRRYEDPMVA